MNVRIAADGIRFRITAEEQERLQAQGTLQETVPVPGHGLVIRIETKALAEVGPLALRWEKAAIVLEVDSGSLAEWGRLPPSREGLQGQAGPHLRCALEVDVRSRRPAPR